MDFLASPTRRKILFGMLYLSEGAPIGFIWLGLPTRLKVVGVPLDQITWLLALLILPWTLKFLWAPIVDLLRVPSWGFKHWVLASQFCMAVSLLPLMQLDIAKQFPTIKIWLIVHAVCAATQDISIDALCMQESKPTERGALNGWMQCGVLVGRAAMGGGSLMLERWIGFAATVAVLIGLILSSSVLLWFAKEQPQEPELTNGHDSSHSLDTSVPLLSLLVTRIRSMVREMISSLRSHRIWAGFLFALTAPAAFKSIEAVIGPFLIDRGYSEYQIGQFSSTIMIGSMIVGSLLAGRLAGRSKGSRFVAIALVLNVAAILLLGGVDFAFDGGSGWHLLLLLGIVALTIGWFTVALYQWLMNLTSPRLAATQFTAFMAATNACEAWSTGLFGTLQVQLGYPVTICLLCIPSACSAVLLIGLRPKPEASPMG